MQLSGRPVYELYKPDEERFGTKRKRGVKAEQHARKRSRRVLEGDDGDVRQKQKAKKPRLVLMFRLVSHAGAASPAVVNIARHRMFYGQPARRPDGKLYHGLPPLRLSN